MLSSVERFENATVSGGRVEFTENNDWSCDLSPSPFSFVVLLLVSRSYEAWLWIGSWTI